MMRKVTLTAFVCLAGLLATGCTAPGKWTLRDLDPSVMRADFSPHVLTLQKDKTYYAETPQGETQAGTWQWKGLITGGLLVLRERGGESASYKASMRDNNTLVLEMDVAGTPVKAIFERKE
jgi:hypothetical protein